MGNTPIRIAQVIGIMNHGGVEAIVMNYYRSINHEKVQFDFFVDETSSFPQREEIERLGGRYFLVPPYSKPLKYIRLLTKCFRQNKYTVVHAQINTMSVFPLFAAWLAGVRVRICHNHSTAHKGEGTKTILKYLLRPLARLFATHYFACGETAARWIFGDGLVDQGMVSILPNAINLSFFRYSIEDRRAARAELNLKENNFVIGHIGRFIFQKNHAFLLRIFQAVVQHQPDAILILAGEGELLESIKSYAFSLGIEHNVRFLGVRNDVNRLYSAMDVFCLPSYYEGLPVVMVEALSNGLSCVTSDLVTDELNHYNVTQLSLNDDVTVWAQTLIRSLRKETISQEFEQKFDIERAARSLEDFYLKESGAAT